MSWYHFFWTDGDKFIGCVYEFMDDTTVFPNYGFLAVRRMSKAKRIIHETNAAERREYLAKVESENTIALICQGRTVRVELEQG